MKYIKDQIEKLDELNSILSVLNSSINSTFVHQYHVKNVVNFLSNNFSDTLKILEERIDHEDEQNVNGPLPDKYDYKALEEIQNIWAKDYIVKLEN
jgi:hypothetical protein